MLNEEPAPLDGVTTRKCLNIWDADEMIKIQRSGVS